MQSLWINYFMFVSGIDQIEKSSALVHQSMTFPRGSGTVSSSAVRVSLVVFRLEVSPFTELVVVLDIDLGHGIK